MHINDIECLAMRLRRLQRRGNLLGTTREDLIMEIGDIAHDLEKQVDRMDREMDEIYLAEQASRHDFAMDR